VNQAYRAEINKHSANEISGNKSTSQVIISIVM
jgi:hypothetical protein